MAISRSRCGLLVELTKMLAQVLRCDTVGKLLDVLRSTHCDVVAVMQSQEGKGFDIVQTMGFEDSTKGISGVLTDYL